MAEVAIDMNALNNIVTVEYDASAELNDSANNNGINNIDANAGTHDIVPNRDDNMGDDIESDDSDAEMAESIINDGSFQMMVAMAGTGKINDVGIDNSVRKNASAANYDIDDMDMSEVVITEKVTRCGKAKSKGKGHKKAKDRRQTDTLVKVAENGELAVNEDEMIKVVMRLQKKFKKAQKDMCANCKNQGITKIHTTVKLGESAKKYNMHMYLFDMVNLAKEGRSAIPSRYLN